MRKLNRSLTLWSGTVFGVDFRQRLDAAVAGGFTTFSLFPIDEAEARRTGLSHADMRAMMADKGVSATVLDPFCQWVPRWEPPNGMRHEDLAFMDFDRSAFFTAARGLGVKSMSVIEVFGQHFETDELTSSFATLCDQAAEHDLNVHLEFMPFSGIADLKTAWQIVSTANRPNGGLVFDFWHYFRGQRNDALLASIPGEKIMQVQVSDAPAQAESNLLDESMHRRLLPGTGSFETQTLLSLLESRGALTSVGAEVFSDALAQKGPLAAAEAAGRALRDCFDERRRIF